MYWYLHTNGTVQRKPDLVVEMAGGPGEYFTGPNVQKVWHLDKTKMTDQELACFNTADHFTTCRGRRPEGRDKKAWGSIEECLAYASAFEDGKTMIYAVTEQGRSAHLLNG